MTTILIVDAVKSSIVMTSEIIKDHLPGSTIIIAGNGNEAIKIAAQQPISLVIADIDLPDTDGITLTKYLRQFYRFPILITTFPEPVIIEAINLELFAYQDASDWLKKPLKADEVAIKLERYVTNKTRIDRQFHTTIDALLSPTVAKGKKAAQVKGNIVNLSINGALVELAEKAAFAPGDEVVLAMVKASSKNEKTKTPSKADRKAAQKAASKAALKAAKTITSNQNVIPSPAPKFTAKITWTNKSKSQLEILFENLTGKSLKVIEEILRKSEALS